MTAQRFTLVKGWVDTAGRTRTWKLIDAKGKIRAEMTCKSEAGEVIAALNMADILTRNCAKVGLCVVSHARYQVAEDEFNEWHE